MQINYLQVDYSSNTLRSDSNNCTIQWPVQTAPGWSDTNVSSITYYNTPIVITPEIKTLEIKGNLLFYYWNNSLLFYAVYKKGEKLHFESTEDFLEVLSNLGAFK